MAGGTERILKRRIKSVQSTKKITRAMELIAASRIVRAQQRVAAARPYAEEITKVIENLAAGGAGLAHPLLQEKEDVRTVGYVVITADRGLAGAYNANVIRLAERSLKRAQNEGKDYSLILVGKKGESYFRYRNYKIDASFEGMGDQPTYEDARQVAAKVIEAYEEGRVDRVELVFTRFLSVGSQRPVVHRFIPLDRSAIEEKTEAHEGPTADYEFEPEPSEILSRLLPRYVEARLYSAMLDAAASEHAARQRAMKSATDNAEDLITRLSRQMNRARQDAITTEIMEIVGGAEALRQGKSDEKDYFVDTVVSRDVLPDQIDPSRR
ncbi:MAG: F-type H+-transporting ATPase subunit gamma [Actinomycetota bacterium]|nr:F-type H+-transporting ATPase subunit gamma [Actinomycetota bacterium]